MTDTALLKYKMAKAGKTVADLAAKMGISPAALRNRINGRTEFTVHEMQHIVNALFLSAYDANRIFFGDRGETIPSERKALYTWPEREYTSAEMEEARRKLAEYRSRAAQKPHR